MQVDEVRGIETLTGHMLIVRAAYGGYSCACGERGDCITRRDYRRDKVYDEIVLLDPPCRVHTIMADWKF